MIIPGYIVGIICLIIITYRSIVAFFNDNKAITVSINKYGEQYFDIAALAVIWSVCLISLFFLVKALRKESLLKKYNYQFQKKPVFNRENYFIDLDIKNKLDNKNATFIGYISESNSKIRRKFKEKK